MFRFLELSPHGWDLWPAVRVPLDRDVVLVPGTNGSGKTTLLDAIRQLLDAPRLSSKLGLENYLPRAPLPPRRPAGGSGGAAPDAEPPSGGALPSGGPSPSGRSARSRARAPAAR